MQDSDMRLMDIFLAGIITCILALINKGHLNNIIFLLILFLIICGIYAKLLRR